jgi:hypothetical protein
VWERACADQKVRVCALSFPLDFFQPCSIPSGFSRRTAQSLQRTPSLAASENVLATRQGIGAVSTHPSTRVAANSLDTQTIPGKRATSELGLECANALKQTITAGGQTHNDATPHIGRHFGMVVSIGDKRIRAFTSNNRKASMHKDAKSKALGNHGPRDGGDASGLSALKINIPNYAGAIVTQVKRSRSFHECENHNQTDPLPSPAKADTSPPGNNLKPSPVSFVRRFDHCVERAKAPALA